MSEAEAVSSVNESDETVAKSSLDNHGRVKENILMGNEVKEKIE